MRGRLFETHGLPTFPPKTKRSLNAISDYTPVFANRKHLREIPWHSAMISAGLKSLAAGLRQVLLFRIFVFRIFVFLF
jgi:hypothetical protein